MPFTVSKQHAVPLLVNVFNLTYINSQMVTNFVDPRYWHVSIVFPEDDPLRVETC
jgi:sulfopyruvate decarboxylase TPP-binding subunit